MAYDTYLAERIRQYFTEQQLNFFEKKMMGGLVFMLNDKMCCGIHFDKKRNCDLLMARVGGRSCSKPNVTPGLLSHGIYRKTHERLCLYRPQWFRFRGGFSILAQSLYCF